MMSKPISRDEFLEALRCWDGGDEDYTEESRQEYEAFSEALDLCELDVIRGLRACCEQRFEENFGKTPPPYEVQMATAIMGGMRFAVDMMKKLYETRELERMLATTNVE